MRTLTRSLVCTAGVLLPSLVLAQSSVDIAGHWEGAVQAPGMAVSIEIDIVPTQNGQLSGTFGQPAEHVRGLQLHNFAISGHAVTFQVKGGGPGQRVFTGDVSPDGKTIAGEYASQLGPFAFSVTRTGDARIELAPPSAAIGKDLEGTWEGTLEVDGGISLVLRLTNQSDGTAVGTLVNQNQAFEIPISAIVQHASEVKLDVKAVEGSFSGALNASGTELTGTFAQRSFSMPMTFRRTK